ncbi:ATPase AAA [Mangrovibacter sp. MFB070]|uniref:AAA family ATPase n=1 Tax=Mangrovibacter sp. MFB070 TaxID=1224318 RepID=UPI0004D9B7F3|nr:AAA family ATPase [Mangrovibacter sp. MFB070]KEA53382.1 ATPase AAA [Mangrovibacter sp. MFB070]
MKQLLSAEHKTVILVNGIPASGKSTVTQALSQQFGLPSLTLDGIKEPFMAQFPAIDRQLNRQLGCAAYAAIWSVIAAAPANCIWLVDAWFGFQPREQLQVFLQQARVREVLEVWNQVSPELAVSRYARRLEQRKPGHPGEEYLPELAVLAQSARPMSIGPVYTFEQGEDGGDSGALFNWVTHHIASEALVG